MDRTIPPDYSEFLVYVVPHPAMHHAPEEVHALFRELGSAAEMTDGVWWLFSRNSTTKDVHTKLSWALRGSKVIVGDLRIENGAIEWSGLDLQNATNLRIEAAWTAFTQGRNETFPAGT